MKKSIASGNVQIQMYCNVRAKKALCYVCVNMCRCGGLVLGSVRFQLLRKRKINKKEAGVGPLKKLWLYENITPNR